MTAEEYRKYKEKKNASLTIEEYRKHKERVLSNNTSSISTDISNNLPKVNNTSTSMLNRTDNTKFNPYIQRALTPKPLSENSIAEIKAYKQEQQEKADEQERWDNLSIGEKIADPFKTMGANIKYGDLGIEESQAWSEYRSKQDEASLVKAQEATKAKAEYELSNDRVGKGNALTKNFAQYLPQLGGQLGAGLGGAVAGAGAGAAGGAGVALAAGQLGPQVAVPEEIATVPIATVTGATWGGRGGYVAGTAKYSYDLMVGSAYKSLLDMGVPNEVALELSGDEALINSLIEGGGAIVDLITLGFGKLATKGTTTTAKKVAQNRLLAAAKAYGLNLVTEPLEEVAQEKVSIETEKKAADISGIERQATEEDDWQRLKDTYWATVKTQSVAGGINAGGNIVSNTVSNKIEQVKADKEIADMQDLYKTQQAVDTYKKLSPYSKYQPQEVNTQISSKDVKPKVEVQTPALPEGGKIYVDPQGVAVDASNYVAPRQNDIQNGQYSPVNARQVFENTEQNQDQFHKGLEKFNSKQYKQQDDIVVLNETPQYLYNLGFDEGKPLVLNMSKLATIMKEPKGKFNGKNQHGITMDVIEQLPNALQNPLNVIKNPKHNERVVVVTELTDQYGDIVIVPIEMNTDGYIENIENDVNRINTVYGKENYDIPKEGNDKGYIQYNEDKIVYDVDKDITKKRDINSDYRLQLPSTAINTSNNIVNQNDSSVNIQYAQNEQNDTADTQSAFSMPKNKLYTRAEQQSKLRSFYQTAQEGSAVDEQYVKDIKKNKETFEYKPITNEETLNSAREEVKKDVEKAERDFLSSDGKDFSAEDTAIAELLIVEAQKSGDYKKANYLSATLAEKLTQAGQAIQATKIFKRMTPEGMILYAQNQINKANRDLKNDNPKLYKKLQEEGALPKLDDDDIKKITEYMQEAQNAPDDYWNSRQKDVLIAKALTVAANKIPSDVFDKVASIRRSGLLLNIKTLNRNIGSNAAFGILEMIKDIPATGIDKLTSLATGKRTTTLPNLKAYGKGMKKGAIEGVEDIKENISTTGGGGRYELPSGKNYELPSKTFKREDSYKDIVNTFKSGDIKGGAKKAFRRALSDYEDAAMYIVEGTDRPFWQGRFESELANQMKLNGLEYGIDTPTNEMLETAKKSADYATFKNKNKLSEIFGGLKRAANGGKPIGAADILGFTFTNVPGSVGSKVYNYSPAGVLTSAKELYYAITKNEKFNQRNFVDSVSRALIGSGGWALGSYLIAQGIIRGARDDDDDKANAEIQMGLQENSLNISALGRLIKGEDPSLQKGDKFYSFDWLQPVSAPLLIGADVNKAKENGESTVLEGAKSAVNQVADMSSLSQVSKLFRGYTGGDVAENMLKVVGEFPSSFIPTLWNNAGQFTDENKRVTYDNSDLFYATNVNKILSKIPGLREGLEKQIDTFGNKQKQYNNGNDFWSTFVNPGYNSTYDPTPLQEEILRLYNETGDKGVFPITAGGSLTYKNENIKLNPKQKMTYQKTSGEYISQILPVVIESEAYKNFNDTQKVNLLKEAISDSNILGKASVGVKTGAYDDYMKKVNNLKGVSLANYYIAYTAQKGIESDKDSNGKTIENSKSIKVKEAIDKATPNIPQGQRETLYEIFNVSKTVREGSASLSTLPTLAEQRAKLPSLKK